MEMPRFRVGEHVHDLTARTLVAAIVDGSESAGLAHRAEQLVADGADLLHVAQSGEPIARGMTEREERAIVVRAVAALEAVGAPVSADLSHSGALAAACDAGVAVGRDVSGFADPEYLPVAAARGVSVVARSTPSPARPVVARVAVELRERAMRAEAAGLAADRVALDPGWLGASHGFIELGYAVAFSAPGDRFTRESVGLSADDRGAGALAAVAYAVMQGCRILFVQDVSGAVRVCRMIEALLTAPPDRASAAR